MNLNKLKQIRANKPINLSVTTDKNTRQELASWEIPPGSKDANAQYVLEYKLPTGDKSHKQQISGSDTSCYLSSLKPNTNYFLRILAVDFAKNSESREWSEFIEFVSSRQAPSPPSVLEMDSGVLLWGEVDQSGDRFEVSYCKAEGAVDVNVEKCEKFSRKLTVPSRILVRLRNSVIFLGLLSEFFGQTSKKNEKNSIFWPKIILKIFKNDQIEVVGPRLLNAR